MSLSVFRFFVVIIVVMLGCASVVDVLIELIFVCANGLRRIVMWTMLGSWMLLR